MLSLLSNVIGPVSCNQYYNMAVVNFMKTISMIKKLFQIALFVAFLYMTVRALIDVFSNRTELIVTKELRNITFLPAFSVCENWVSLEKGFDKKDLVNGSMVLQSFDMDFIVWITFDNGNGVTGVYKVNLMKDFHVQKFLYDVNLVDLWTLQCKPFIKGKSHCMPCITFNGARLTTQDIEVVTVNSLKKIN